MSKDFSARHEMDIYCQYLVGRQADEHSLALFEKAILQHKADLSPTEQHLLLFMINHPSSVRFIDAAVGMFHPNHILRKRMVIAFAILETNPLYYDFFCPKQCSIWYLPVLGWKGMRQLVQALAGKLLMLAF